MPFKHNASRRHHIPRARYRVTNWPSYEAGLRRRGDLTVWVDEAALAGWQAPRRSTPGGQPPEVIIPPRADAVPSTTDPDKQSPRDCHIQLMAERGRIGWQRATGYGKRNHVETTMGRYKHLIGPKLRARSRSAQHGEVALAVQVLNRMIREAKPVSIRR